MPKTAVGTFTNPTTPWGAAEILNVDGGQSLRVSHGLPWYRTSDYANLGALWAAAGAGPYDVIVNSNIAVTANLGLGAGIHVVFEPDYRITVNNLITFTVYSPENVHAGPRQWIFTLAGTGAVAWTSGGRISATWFASFANAVASAGVGDPTILVPTGQIIAADLTVPAGVQIEVTRPGAWLTVNNGVTLTIHSPEHIRAKPRQQLFALVGTGLVAFTRPGTVYPAWWGAAADGVTDDIVPIRAADAAALASGSILVFPPAVYLISATWEVVGNDRVISGYGARLQTNADVTAIQLGTVASGIIYRPTIEGLHLRNVASVPVTSVSAGLRVYNTIGVRLRELRIGDYVGPNWYGFGRGLQYQGAASYWYNHIGNCDLDFNHVGIYGLGNDTVLDTVRIAGGLHGIVLGYLDANNAPDLTEENMAGAGENVILRNPIIYGQATAGAYGLFVKHSADFPTIVGGHFESINGVGIQVGFTSPANRYVVRGGSIHDCLFKSTVPQPIAIGGAWWNGNVAGCKSFHLTAPLIDATSHYAGASSIISLGENYVQSTVIITDPDMHLTHSADWYPFVDHTNKVADYPVVIGDSGKLFDNAAAGGSVTFTLPALALAWGCAFGFQKVANQTMLVSPGAATIQGLAATEALELQNIGDTVWLESLAGVAWHIRSAATQRAWRERGEVTHNFGGAAVAWILTFNEASGVSFILTNANGAASVQFPAAGGVGHAVKLFTLYNNAGFNMTVKVVGGVGVTATNGKRSIWVLNGTDCVKIYEQP